DFLQSSRGRSAERNRPDGPYRRCTKSSPSLDFVPPVCARTRALDPECRSSQSADRRDRVSRGIHLKLADRPQRPAALSQSRSNLSPSITAVAFGSTFPSQGLITVAPTSEILSARILAAATNESVRAMAALDFTIRDSSTRLGITKDYSFDSGTAFSAALNPI